MPSVGNKAVKEKEKNWEMRRKCDQKITKASRLRIIEKNSLLKPTKLKTEYIC